METQRATITDIATDFFTSTHFFTVVAGVMIAIICALVLLTDVNLYQTQSVPFNPSTTTSVVGHQVVKMTEVSVNSVLSRLK